MFKVVKTFSYILEVKLRALEVDLVLAVCFRGYTYLGGKIVKKARKNT